MLIDETRNQSKKRLSFDENWSNRIKKALLRQGTERHIQIHSLLFSWGSLLIRISKTLGDVYMICQEFHSVGVVNNPHRA